MPRRSAACRLAALCCTAAAAARSCSAAYNGGDSGNGAYNFTPANLSRLTEGSTSVVRLLVANCSAGSAVNMSLSVSDAAVAGCTDSLQYWCNGSAGSAAFSVTGLSVGFANIVFRDESGSAAAEYFVGVVRQPTVWDDIFNYFLMVVVILNSFCFGVALNLDVVKKDVKKPLAVLLGLGAQFILMPVVGFGLTKIFDLSTKAGQALAVGVYATSVAPGGGASNIWCLLLDADADLSIVVTFIGAVICLGLIPFWFYTLGTLVFSGSEYTIPFVAILQAVAIATVPIILGLPVRKYLPRATRVILKILPPFSFVIVLLLVGTGTYANLYSFVLLYREPLIAVCAVVLPYGGLLLGAALGLAARLPAKRVKTLAIEVMVKNINISVLVLRYSLAQPWSDYSSAVPLCFSHIAMIPTLIALIARGVCLCKRRRTKTLERGVDGAANPAFSADDAAAGTAFSDIRGLYKPSPAAAAC